MSTSLSWKEFWNSEHNVYVSEKHKKVIADTQTKDLLSLVPSTRPLTFLDYGCGEARMANELVRHGITVKLFDAIPKMHQQLLETFEGKKEIQVVTESEIRSLQPKSIDVILVHSVLQYLSKEFVTYILPQFHRLLSPTGVLYLSDVVTPSASSMKDACSLLVVGRRHKFLLDVFFGLVRTFLSNYRAVKAKNGFTTYEEEEILEIVRSQGFTAVRMPKNIGISPHRMLIQAIKS